MKLDLALLSEPNLAASKDTLHDATGRAAIYLPRTTVDVDGSGTGGGFVWARIGEVTFYSCYYSPNDTLAEFESQLEELRESVERTTGPVVVGGDFNAKSPEWGSTREDPRGEALADIMGDLNLGVCNVGTKPTYVGRGDGSVIDVTWTRTAHLHRVTNWEVLDTDNNSDHRYLRFNVEMAGRGCPGKATAPKGWAARKLRKEDLETALLAEKEKPLPKTPGELTEMLGRVCDKSMPLRSAPGRPPVHWWTPEIAAARKEATKLGRLKQRTPRDSAARTIAEGRHKAARRELASKIENSKRSCWRELLGDLDNDPWGLAYKIVQKKLRGRKDPGLTPSKVREVADHLFPKHQPFSEPKLDVPQGSRQSGAPAKPFTLEELRAAAEKISPDKAPGPDGVPGRVVKTAAKRCPEHFLSVFNDCLAKGVFPAEWKISKLVLIRKGNKPPEAPSSYRPICLLNHAAKLLERMISNRLKLELENRGGLSSNQYGFRTGKSTTDALNNIVETVKAAKEGTWRTKKFVMLVTLDVKNAFNSAGWQHILAALKELNIDPEIYNILVSYLSERRLLLGLQEDGDETPIVVTSGVPQGSVLGPLLWNIMYDGVLRLKLPEGVKIVGFADDITLIIEDADGGQLQTKANEAIRIIWEWISAKGLELVPEKSEAVVVCGQRKEPTVDLQLNGKPIMLKKEVTVLGVVLDKHLNFASHIEKATAKAQATTNSLARLMPNIGGPATSKRKTLGRVTQSVILYAAPVWSDAVDPTRYGTQRNRHRLQCVQRRAALRVICGYRTMSAVAALVLASMPPLDIQVRERAGVSTGQSASAASEKTMAEWQAKWDNAECGRWTHRLIPNIKKWVERGHGELSYHLTQMLSGHGCFNAYLNRFALRDIDTCAFCSESDTSEHTFFQCWRWERPRQLLSFEIGELLTPDNIVHHMLGEEGKWTKIVNFITTILKAKQLGERQEQANITPRADDTQAPSMASFRS